MNGFRLPAIALSVAMLALLPTSCELSPDDMMPTSTGMPEAFGLAAVCNTCTQNGAADLDNDGDGYCEDNAACSDGSLPFDCHDGDPNIFPGAAEICDGRDNDCNAVDGLYTGRDLFNMVQGGMASNPAGASSTLNGTRWDITGGPALSYFLELPVFPVGGTDLSRTLAAVQVRYRRLTADNDFVVGITDGQYTHQFEISDDSGGTYRAQRARRTGGRYTVLNTRDQGSFPWAPPFTVEFEVTPPSLRAELRNAAGDSINVVFNVNLLDLRSEISIVLGGNFGGERYGVEFLDIQQLIPTAPGVDDIDDDGDGANACPGPGRDCDDGDPAVNPSATELCNDGIDNDCSGATPDVFDLDLDDVNCIDDCDDNEATVYGGLEGIRELVTDGGFESGALGNWPGSTGSLGSCPSGPRDWNVSSSGSATGCSNIGAPASGSFAAYNMFDGPGNTIYEIRQEVIIPRRTFDATLSWADNIRWSGSTPRTFSITLEDGAGASSIELYRKDHTGSGTSGGWVNRSVDVTALLRASFDPQGGVARSLAERTRFLALRAEIPGAWEGPGGMGVDNVSLLVDGSDAAQEVCDGLDNDCDGAANANPLGLPVVNGPEVDDDGDGERECDGDCNDLSTGANSSIAVELEVDTCDDTLDNDCDGALDCADPDCLQDTFCSGCFDDDGDGAPQDNGQCSAAAYDCDDNDPNVFPGAPELCDGLDNDCDPATEHPDGEQDDDLDGYPICDDCDDQDPSVHPGSIEICDGRDNDCNGLQDAGNPGASNQESDLDGDGFVPCDPWSGPPGAFSGGDCDDTSAAARPGGAAEGPGTCNDLLDNDCNGLADCNDTNCVSDPTCGECVDSDGDGWFVPDPNDPNARCLVERDCDDADANRFPGNPERCDGIDNDCDANIDQGLDGDGDGVTPCGSDGLAGTADDDCDDADPDNFGGNPETCDGADNDCDGLDDFGNDGTVASEIDNDGDGLAECDLTGAGLVDCDDADPDNFEGNPETCDGADNDCNLLDDAGNPGVGGWETDDDSDGLSECDGDCDDNAPNNYPGNSEACDGQDNDCDGVADNGLDTDDDGDGHYTLGSCAAPNDDCDDADPDNFPTNPESCDGVDNDCDGLDDYGNDGTAASEIDNDGDGLAECDLTGTGFVDCDDADPDNFGGNTETCDGRDNDCNLLDDAGNPGVGGWETDNDGDGLSECRGDCDDNAPNNYPGNSETCDGEDNDCNGLADLPGNEVDADADGSLSCADCDDLNPNCDSDCTDADVDGYCVTTDCDDADRDSFPGNPEVCDGADNDCSGAADAPGGEGDGDGDGTPTCADCDDANPNCDADCTDSDTDGFCVTTDCDDADPDNFPGNTESCDRADNDCNGVADFPNEVDQDGDDVWQCEGDCDDGNPLIYDGAPELCDRVDNDCDNALPADETDDDSDGQTECEGDCADDDDRRYVGNVEICDGADNDCNSTDDAGAPGLPFQETDNDNDGRVECDGDCDDNDSTSFGPAVSFPAPGGASPEICDGLDNDCDGDMDAPSAQPGTIEVGETEVDDDLDGRRECEGDCDDDNDRRFGPFGNRQAFPEVCDDIDNDCGCPEGVDPTVEPERCVDDGLFTFDWYPDEDGDLWGSDTARPITTCRNEPPGGTATTRKGDCDDSDPTIHNGAPERCDGLDNDCRNGVPDVELDDDGDGVSECQGDCNDADALTFPDLGTPPTEGKFEEACNDNEDNDCDGRTDARDSDCLFQADELGCWCTQIHRATANPSGALLLVPALLLLRRRSSDSEPL